MKNGPLLRKIVYSTWILAAIPAIVTMCFLPVLNSRYNLILENHKKASGQYLYADINSDSTSELIIGGKGVPFYYLLVMGRDNKIYDQWNLRDIVDLSVAPFFVGNYNHDKFSEIYVFTHKDDSLFLNINEFFEPEGLKRDRIFISKIGYLKGEITSIVFPVGFHDVNGDGKDELYFTITTGFGVVPRKIFCYDIAANVLTTGPETGIMLIHPLLEDTDSDGRPEIFGAVSGSGNQPKGVPFTDWSTWLMVFNDKLEFKFKPVEFPGYPSLLDISSYRSEHFQGYILSKFESSADSTVPQSSIMLFTADGKLVREKSYSYYGFNSSAKIAVTGNGKSARIFLLSERIFEINEKLEIINSYGLEFNSYYRTYRSDINSDGKDEFFLYSYEEEKVILLNSDMKKLCSLKIKIPDKNWYISSIILNGKIDGVLVSLGNESFVLRLETNKYYFMSYLAYPGIYFAFFIFIFFTKRIATYQVIQRESLKQRLLTLQLQGIKSQLDPHFTFNTLNSVASLIYTEERQAAYDYMSKYTMLLRGMLNDAERIYRTLGEEIDFVQTYLDLEKLRFNGRFDYTIHIGEGVSLKEQVPKLVLQTFAENSIKHGIAPNPSGGIIIISALREKDYLKLEIKDTGIGRAKASGQSGSTGKGLKLTNEFYEILNQINKKHIRFEITDMHNSEGNPSGTRVEVWVPVE